LVFNKKSTNPGMNRQHFGIFEGSSIQIKKPKKVDGNHFLFFPDYPI
jgi:hypothetical protein